MIVSRRRFFATTAAAAIASRAARATPVSRRRAEEAYAMRERAAASHRGAFPASTSNGDDARYENRAASFSKGLPHDADGDVDRDSYELLLRAVESGAPEDFDRIPGSGAMKLANPQAALAYELQGADPQQFALEAPPRLDSEEQAGEAAELYWQALARDVGFADYAIDGITNAAAQDLARFHLPSYGFPSAQTLFRGTTGGDLDGPYVSQFLLHDVPCGALKIAQRAQPAVAGEDYGWRESDWLALQRGFVPETPRKRRGKERLYIRNGRDLAAYVRNDPLHQLFTNAALILLSSGAPTDPANPYRFSRNQSGFVTFGGPAVLDLVARVANSALKAAWYQKWIVHRRLRPEEYGGRLNRMLLKRERQPLDDAITSSPAVEQLFRERGTYLLPQAYPDAAPLHPSYPGGHAAIAGACVTVLKAYFDESHIMPMRVVASRDGTELLPIEVELSVGGELDKLAANVSLGRNFAGIHWRSDHYGGLRLGEAVAIAILRDMKECFNERTRAMTLTTFEGVRIEI